MMRILHNIGGIGLGGSQTFVMELYRQIDKNEIQFDFVIFADDEGGYRPEIERMGGRIFMAPRYSAKNHIAFCKWWNSFFEAHKEYSVIHGHVYSCAAVYLPIAKKYGLKTICHAHSTSNGGNFFVERIKKAYEFPLRYIPDYLFACSSDAGKWLYGKNIERKHNYKVIQNCINVDKFEYSTSSRIKIRSQYGISDSTFLIGHVGSFRLAKNHEFIIRIFEGINREIPDSKLLLVGTGDRRKDIEQLCLVKGLTESVIFAGNQHEISSYYSAMDSFLFPSLWEGLPVSVVEAQASGLKCLISDTITKDVLLTNLVETMSLEQPVEQWVSKIVSYRQNGRDKIPTEEKEKLMSFDSKAVGKWLQLFYLGISANNNN